MGSEDKTNTYDETVSRTTSEPPTETTVTEAVTATPEGTVEKYEVRSETAPEEESVSEKAREAGRSLRELVHSLGKKTKEVTEEKARELKAQSQDIGAATDARDIQQLGDNVEKLLSVFEDTMTEIRKEPYDEQERLLAQYWRFYASESSSVINQHRTLQK